MDRFAVSVDNYKNNVDRASFPQHVSLQKWNLEKSPDWQYTLEHGSEYSIIQFINAHKEKQVCDFYGYCYTCGCPMHFQNYCPVKRCKQCLLYGHSSKVCPLRERFQH